MSHDQYEYDLLVENVKRVTTDVEVFVDRNRDDHKVIKQFHKDVGEILYWASIELSNAFEATGGEE